MVSSTLACARVPDQISRSGHAFGLAKIPVMVVVGTVARTHGSVAIDPQHWLSVAPSGKVGAGENRFIIQELALRGYSGGKVEQ